MNVPESTPSEDDGGADSSIAAPSPPSTPKGKRGTRVAVGLYGIPLLVIALLSLFAPLLPLPGPSAQNLAARLSPPFWQEGGSLSHPLGTDQLGRDMLSRLIYGGRLTFLIAGLAMMVGAVFGITVGLVAGYWRGKTDVVLSRLIDAQLALPFILLAMAVIVATGRSVLVLVAVLAIVGWAQYARVIRAETLSMRERPFVLGLRAAGASKPRILIRHILPNVAGTVLVLSTLEIGTMILAESALSFLGLGVVEPQLSWGGMLAQGRDYLRQAWWVVALPGIAITVVVICVNLLGDALRAQYDPRKRTY